MHYGRRISHLLGVRGTVPYVRGDGWMGVVQDKVSVQYFLVEGSLVDLNTLRELSFSG